MKPERHLRIEQFEQRQLLSASAPMAWNTAALQSPGVFAAAQSLAPRAPAQAITIPRSIDGSGNNLAHADWGSAGEDLLRKAPAAYADGVSTPSGANRPSAREISNALSDQAGLDIISDRGLSAMTYAWGQFIDHDIDLTPSGGKESLPIAVPKGDPWFDPASTDTATIPLSRSVFDAATGTGVGNPRQQINTVTAFIDGSMIYGSDAATAAKLRTFSGGQLKTSDGGMLPLNDAATFPTGALTMANDAHRVPSSQLFAAGDVRANENVELTSLHTIFVREHNLWAGRIAAANPGLADEAIYQRARAMVVGEIQAITYNQWLPAVLGGAIAPYRGYNANVNPGVTTEFSTAAFRFGHSLLGDDVEFLNDQGRPIADEVALSEAFFNPTLLKQNGVDSVLKYLASDPSSELDMKVVDSVRNFLFGPPGSGGLDLASLNIQRGRDHGLADYNTTRAAYGLPKVSSFAEINSDPQVQAKLQSLYGSVNNIDLWVGILAENRLPGASIGATGRAIIADQFQRLRDGDRYWFENTMTPQVARQVAHTSLTDVIRRNTDLKNLQDNPFFFQASISGALFSDANHNGQRDPGDPTAGGLNVQLVNLEDGTVVASQRSDPRGNYKFDVPDGLRTGQYQVRVELPPGPQGQTPPAAASPALAITRGDLHLQGVNINVPPPPRPASSRPGGPAQPGNPPAPGGADPMRSPAGHPRLNGSPAGASASGEMARAARELLFAQYNPDPFATIKKDE